MTTTITFDGRLLPRLILVKRVFGHKNMTEVLEYILQVGGFNEEWEKRVSALLEDGKP